MGQNGGKRAGSGRPPGSRNRNTAEQMELAREMLAESITPLDVMRARMLNRPLSNGMMPTYEQFAAACALAPFLHPKLTAVAFKDVNAPDEVTIEGGGMSALLRAARASPKPQPYQPKPPEPEIIEPRHPPIAPAPPGFAWMIDLSKLKEIEDDA